MKKSSTAIADYIGSDNVITVERKPIDPNNLDGFVIAASTKLLALHVVDGRTLQLDGYSILRMKDISAWKELDGFTSKALRLLARRPEPLAEIDLTDWRTVIESLKDNFPFIKIEAEKKHPGCCFIGRQRKLSKRSIELHTVSTSAKWDIGEEFDYDDITRISVGDGYVNALVAVMESEGAVGPGAKFA